MENNLQKDANFILGLLADASKGNAPDAVLGAVLNETEQNTVQKNLVKKLSKIQQQYAIGVLGHGVKIIETLSKDHGLDTSTHYQKAIVAALKDNDRIMQCGRGKGKALIVLQDTPLSDEEVGDTPEKEENQVQEATKEASVPDMLRAIRDQHRYMQKENLTLKRDIADLNKQLEIRNKELEQISRELEMKTIATWQ